MGLGDLLKRALGAVGEFDRKVVYGPDYKARSESLAQLNDLTIRAKLLENQDKFERIQGMRQELADRERTQKAWAFKEAMVLGSQVPPTDSGIAGPPNDANPADLAGKNLLFEPPSFLKERLSKADNSVLQKAIQEEWRLKQKKEAQGDEIFDMRIKSNEALINQRESSADKNDRWVAGGAGGRAKARFSNNAFRNGEDGKPVFGREIVFDDGTVTFVPSQGGAMPLYGASPSPTEANDIKGMAGSYQDLDKVIADWSKADAAGLLGPIKGGLAQLSAKYAGGLGLSEDQRVLMQSIDRAKTLAAFAEGGKQLTGVEKEYFDTNYPRLSNTSDPKTFIRLARELQAALKRGLSNRMQVMPANRRPSGETINQMFPAPADAGGWVKGPDGVWRQQ